MREVEFIAQELWLDDQRRLRGMDQRESDATYSTSDLDLVVDAAPIRVIASLVLTPYPLPCQVDHPRLWIRLVVLRLLRLREIIDRRRDLAYPFARVPHLEDHVEDISIDLPWSRTEDIQTCVYELEVSLFGGVPEVALLLL